MIAKVRKIGNSTGVLISKAMLAQCDIDSEVNIEIVDRKIMISPVSKTVRQGWEKQFIEADSANDKKHLIEHMKNVFDDEEWTW